MANESTPIALFIYKRPEHTRRALESLSNCHGIENSPVYIFADGAKYNQDERLVAETRAIARQFKGCKKLIMIESNHNKGLANSIISGVTSLVKEFGRIIVLEDDLVLAPGFLYYMNRALFRYEAEPKVMQISGHMFPIDSTGQFNTLFLPFTTSWGWATWQRAWSFFDLSANGWDILLKDKELRKNFNINGSYDYTGMLQQQMEGKIDSWAIRWNWSVFQNNGLILFPRKTLVINNGMDGSGTHGGNVRQKNNTDQPLEQNAEFSFPDEIIADSQAYFEIAKYLNTQTTQTWIRKMQNKIRGKLK